MFWLQSMDRFIFTFMKTKHPVHIIVFEVVTSGGDVLSWSQIQPRGLHQMPGGGGVHLNPVGSW